MKKLKAFLKRDKAPTKEKPEVVDRWGAVGNGFDDPLRTTTPLTRGYTGPAFKSDLNSRPTSISPWSGASASIDSTEWPTAQRATSPVERATSPRRRRYRARSPDRIAPLSSSPPSPTLQSTGIRNGATYEGYGQRTRRRTSRLSSSETHRRGPSHLPNSTTTRSEAATTTRRETAKKEKTEESESDPDDSDDSDMEDLLAMMVAARVVTGMGARDEGSSSSDADMRVLLLGAMLAAKARQERESENKPPGDAGEEGQGLEKSRGQEEVIRKEIGSVPRTAAPRQVTRRPPQSAPASHRMRDTTSRASDYHFGSVAEDQTRRAYEAEEEREDPRRTSDFAPLRGGSSPSVSTSTTSNRTEGFRRSDTESRFKVEPRQKTTAPPTPATSIQDQPDRQVQRENFKSRMAREQAPSAVPASIPTPTPLPSKRKGPVFKVPPLPSAQRAAL